jgi:putative phosphoesterase
VTDPPVDRLALIGDVHGNLSALEATLAAIRQAGIGRGLCTGDIVLRGGEPEACVERIALLEWPAVAGNTDIKVVRREPRPRTHPASERVGSRSWTHHRLSESSMRFLADLPLCIRVAVGRFTVLVMHGAPTDPSEVLVDAATRDATLQELATRLAVDCVVTGHTHRPLIRRSGGCLFVNPGSVGESIGRDRRPSWAWLGAGPAGLVAGLERVDIAVAQVRRPRHSTA